MHSPHETQTCTIHTYSTLIFLPSLFQFDTCVSKLGRLEVNLNQTLNVNVDGDKSEGGYSYICVDPKWDTMQRGGPWSPNDLISLEYLHRDLHQKNPITDLLIR